IYSKQDLGAIKELCSEQLVHPTPVVVISHTTTRQCTSFDTCSEAARLIQLNIIGKRGSQNSANAADIGYNFLIGGDGNVYEGKGWDEMSSHRTPEGILGISFIGNYHKDRLTYGQIEAAQELLALGVKLEKLSPSYILVAHYQTASTDNPEPNPNTTLPGDHVIYSKEDWYGVAPKFERQLKHPTPFVVISHTATPACYSPVVCAARMRNFQDVHMGDSHNFPDIGYSFVVGGDGNVYVGRGWDATNMHSGFVKRCNIGISFIGNFVHDTPTNGQIQAVQELIKLGVSLGKIDKNYKLVAMNETFTTLSPGVVLYGIIAKWPHF
ncbi:Peptidoglycan recognition protein I-alpha, partial [Zootermopsis nevadensis]